MYLNNLNDVDGFEKLNFFKENSRNKSKKTFETFKKKILNDVSFEARLKYYAYNNNKF